jgi:hypothetical protein
MMIPPKGVTITPSNPGIVPPSPVSSPNESPPKPVLGLFELVDVELELEQLGQVLEAIPEPVFRRVGLVSVGSTLRPALTRSSSALVSIAPRDLYVSAAAGRDTAALRSAAKTTAQMPCVAYFIEVPKRV